MKSRSMESWAIAHSVSKEPVRLSWIRMLLMTKGISRDCSCSSTGYRCCSRTLMYIVQLKLKVVVQVKIIGTQLELLKAVRPRWSCKRLSKMMMSKVMSRSQTEL